MLTLGFKILPSKELENEKIYHTYQKNAHRCHKNPESYNFGYAIVQLVYCLGMVVFAYFFASEICYEKGAGLLEFLFIAGVSRWTIKLSWLIFGLFFGEHSVEI